MKIKTIYTPLVVLAGAAFLSIVATTSVASAATFTWTGGGTATEDATASTISYDISDGANWSGGTAPVGDGHTLVFPADLADVDPNDAGDRNFGWRYVVNNDLPLGTEIAGIQYTGDTGDDCSSYRNDRYTIAGNLINLSADVESMQTGSCAVTQELGVDVNLVADVALSDVSIGYYGATFVLDLAGNEISLCDSADSARLTKYGGLFLSDLVGDGSLAFNCGSSVLNATAVTAGARTVDIDERTFANLGASLNDNFAQSVAVGDKATLYIDNKGQATTFSGDVAFAGGNYTEDEYDADRPNSGGSGGSGGAPQNIEFNYLDGQYADLRNRLYVVDFNNSGSMNFAGTVTIASDITMYNDTPVTFSGTLEGTGFSFKHKVGSLPFTISGENNTAMASGSSGYNYRIVEITGEDDTYVLSASKGSRYVLKSSLVGDFTVRDHGVLGGSGTVGALTVESEGLLAPGESPGCISSGDLTLSGTYQVEIQGGTVCSEYDQTDVAGTVDVTDATLEVSFLNDYSPAEDDEYVIINNDGTDAVTGEFTGMANGDSFEIDGTTFRIQYDGGDGNDVVLTAVTVPGAPDTGIETIVRSGLAPIAAVIASVTVLGALRAYKQHN